MKPIDLGVPYEDEGRWRSYELDHDGSEYIVSEVDQDGDVLACYGLDDLPTNGVANAVERALSKLEGGDHEKKI